jgi:hypothetical protein
MTPADPKAAKPRYKDRQMQALYEKLLTLADDRSSELYHNGAQRRGAGHRAASWDGYSGKFAYSGPKRSAHVIPGTLSQACFMAGREFARQARQRDAC